MSSRSRINPRFPEAKVGAVALPWSKRFSLRAPDDSLVRCTRREDGLMKVHADTWVGAYFGWGVAQALDRAAQLDVLRHLAMGQGSQILGNITFPEESGRLGGLELCDVDRFNRILDHRQQGQTGAAALRGELADLYESFALGVSCGAQSASLAPEHLFIGRMRSYSVADALSLPSFYGFTVDVAALDLSVLCENLIGHYGSEAVSALFPSMGIPADLSYKSQHESASTLASWERPSVGGGSNAWAVSGKRTESGAPLLANDPHVPFNPMPSFWYPLSLQVADHRVSGFSFVGMPMMATARTPGVAFGITNIMRDPFWLTELIPAGGKQRYLGPDGPINLERRTESFRCRFGKNQSSEILSGPHGTILPKLKTRNGHPIAVATVPVDVARMAGGYHNALLSTELDGHLNAIDDISAGAFAWNWIFATTSGDIGHHVAGRFWARERGRCYLAKPSQEGWLPGLQEDSTRYRNTNPEDGLVVSANDDAADKDGLRTSAYYPDFRAQRIATLITGEKKHTIDSMRAIQGDLCTPEMIPVAHNLVSIFEKQIAPARPTKAEDAACRVLKCWDGRYDAHEAGPVVLSLILEEFFKSVLGRCSTRLRRNTGLHYKFVERMLQWLAGQDKEEKKRFEKSAGALEGHVLVAFHKGVAYGLAKIGAHPAAWHLGNHQSVHLEHLLGRLPGLGHALNLGHHSYQGGPFTINVAISHLTSEGAQVHTGPVGRFVADMSDDRSAWFELCGGPGGISLSPYRKTMLEDWLHGRMRSFEAPE